MGWTSYHRRGEVLRAVLAAAEARRDGRLPTDIAGVGDTFDDELDLLCTLQLRWHTRLAGRIEHELAGQPLDLESAVVAAWHRAADDLPGVRAILDSSRAQPSGDAMARSIDTSVAKERVLLAVTAGGAAVSDALAAAVGARIEERARSTYVAAPADPRHPRPTLLGRIRAALAA